MFVLEIKNEPVEVENWNLIDRLFMLFIYLFIFQTTLQDIGWSSKADQPNRSIVSGKVALTILSTKSRGHWDIKKSKN